MNLGDLPPDTGVSIKAHALDRMVHGRWWPGISVLAVAFILGGFLGVNIADQETPPSAKNCTRSE